MAALRTCRSLQRTSSLRRPHSLRFDQLVKPISSLQGVQAAHRTYSSTAKETSESEEDPRNKPIRFSTSRARFMTLNQTIGYGVEIDKNPSKKSIYVGLFLFAIITYIIFFLPADEDELDLLELEIEKEEAKNKTR